jgi:hypothetical protein
MHVRLTDRFVKSAVPKGRKSPIFMDDEVIGFECSSFAALRESGRSQRGRSGMSAIWSRWGGKRT